MSNDESMPDIKELNVDFDLPPNRIKAVWEMYEYFKSYRFSQRQILYLIKLIAVELENEKANELIQKIVASVRPQTPLSISDEDDIKNAVSGLILEND